MATKKSNKKGPLKSKSEWTITEFQMWLHGAYSLQGEDWVPTADQWDMIVDIIYKLKDRPAKVSRPVAPPIGPYDYGNGPMIPTHQPDQPPQQPMGANSLLGAMDATPDEANLSLSELKRRRAAGGPSNGNVLQGNAPIGEKEIKTNSFD